MGDSGGFICTWGLSSLDFLIPRPANAFYSPLQKLINTHKEKTKGIMSDKATAKLTSNFSDQKNLKYKFQCKNELIYIRDFKAVQKTGSRVLSGLKILGFASSL